MMYSQHKGLSFGAFKSFRNESEPASSSKESMGAKPTTQEVMDALKGTLTIGTSKEPALKKTMCLKCQGLGHMAHNWPNRAMVLMEEYYNFLMQNKDDVGE